MQWADPVLGDLAWDEAGKVWVGSCDFNGRAVRLELDPDHTNPTRDIQLAVLSPSRSILDRLRQVELQFRRQAAEQIAEAVVCQQLQDRRGLALPEARFADGLQLEMISIHGCGELHYRSPEFFPDWVVTIFFNDDLSFGDAEVYEQGGDSDF
jgi:hypothetical protein